MADKMIEIGEEHLKTERQKRFYQGYSACIDDLKNAICNAIEDDIFINVTENEYGFDITYDKAEYDKLSTMDKIKVELMIKNSKDILNHMNDSLITMFMGLKEGEIE